MKAANPFVKFHNDQRGYVLCTVTPKEWRSDYRTVAEVEKLTTPGDKATTAESFFIAAGKAGLKR